MRMFIVLCTTIFISACANFSPPSHLRQLKPNTQYWSSYDSSRRGGWFATDATGNMVRGCAEPAPDVALSLSTSLKASGKTKGVELDSELSAVSTALALAGRDNVVLLAREALFRVCEQAANGKIPDAKVADLFTTILSSTREIALQQAAKAKEQAVKAQADSSKRNTTSELIKSLPPEDRPKALIDALRVENNN